MKFEKVNQPLTIETAKGLLGKQIKWNTPIPRRIGPGEFSSEREGIVIYALPSCCRPTLCEEIRNAKPSQCYGLGNSKTGSSMNDRLIVRVERTHSITGKVLQPVYFSPRLSAITHQEITDE